MLAVSFGYHKLWQHAEMIAMNIIMIIIILCHIITYRLIIAYSHYPRIIILVLVIIIIIKAVVIVVVVTVYAPRRKFNELSPILVTNVR